MRLYVFHSNQRNDVNFMKKISLLLICFLLMSIPQADAAMTKRPVLKSLEGTQLLSSELEKGSEDAALKTKAKGGHIGSDGALLKLEALCAIPPATKNGATTKADPVIQCQLIGKSSFVTLSQNALFNGRRYSVEIDSTCDASINVSGVIFEQVPASMDISADGTQFTIPPHQTGVFYVNLRSTEILPPGDYRFRMATIDDTVRRTYNYITITVTESTGMTVDVLERARGAGDDANATLDAGLIAKFRHNDPIGFYYSDALNDPVWEDFIADIPAWIFTKKGLTADGNTRLLIRAISEEPGDIYFALGEGAAGFRLETLLGDVLTTEVGDFWGFEAYPMNNGAFYQATVVLIGPKDFQGRNFPKHDFYVEVLKTDSEGYIVEESQTLKELSLVPNPVVLLHGIYGDIGTFGADNEPGFWTQTFKHHLNELGYVPNADDTYKVLKRNTFKVYEWKYDGTKGPSDIMHAFSTDFYDYLKDEVLPDFHKSGIACTQVDIVAHSMGGLMARKYVLDNVWNKSSEIGYGRGLVRRIVTVATPHTGSNIPSYLTGRFDNLDLVNYPAGYSPSLRWFLTHRKTLTRNLHYHSINNTGGYFLRVYEPDVIDMLERNTYISALVDLTPGSPFLKYINKPGNEPTVPMYGISGEAFMPLQRAMDKKILLIERDEEGNPVTVPTRVGGIALTGLTQNSAVRAFALSFQLQALVDALPSYVTWDDIVDLVAVWHPNTNDIIVDGEASHWNFGTYHTLFTATAVPGEYELWGELSNVLSLMHTGVTKHVPAGELIVNLLKGPESSFVLFQQPQTYALNQSTMMAATTSSTQFTDVETAPEFDFEITPEDVITEETMTVQVNPSTAGSGQTIVFTGNVPVGFPEENHIKLHINNVRNGLDNVTLDLEKDENGNFQYQLEGFEFAGVYEVSLSSLNNDLATLYTSPKVTLLGIPNLGNPQRISLGDSSVMQVAEGEKRPILLNVTDGNGKKWEMGHPLLGASYTIENSNIATVDEVGRIVAHSPGKTVLNASFNGLQASKTIHVTPATRVLPSRYVDLLPTTPASYQPTEGQTFQVGTEITFRASPFDSSKAATFKYSYWVIAEVSTGNVVAELNGGAGATGTWVPSNPGQYKWRMCYYHDQGVTDYTSWKTFIVQ